MKVLIIGSGGREHALYWKVSQSTRVTAVHVTPGNGGIPERDRVPAPDTHDHGAFAHFVGEAAYDLVIVGPEQPLVEGLVDDLSPVCPVFGPLAAAARLEGSKAFAKEFMLRHGIPTAQAQSFSDPAAALAYTRSRTLPIVVKADGLAAGKGVTVAVTLAEAEDAIRASLVDRRFGASGNSVLIEDFLQGTEASVFALCDGKRALPFVAAQDHKRAFDGDRGPNTGGMGAFAPTPTVTADVMRAVQTTVLDPVISGMAADGSPYHGLLYAGLMVHDGIPSVVEFNVRFGDPETQALLRLLDEDLAVLCLDAALGRLPDRPLRFHPGSAAVVVLAADGYPEQYRKGISLKNVDTDLGDIIIFHAGTERRPAGLVSTGGRILGSTGIGSGPAEAARRAYLALEKIEAPGTFYRRDIGNRTGST